MSSEQGHTPTDDREVVQVTQADREAAARLVAGGNPGVGNGNKVVASGIKGKLHDNYAVVQAFARHRSAAVNHHQALVEALRGMVGLIQLVRARADLPDELREAIDANHRLIEAEALLSRIGGEGK